MIVMGIVSGSTFRLVSDQASAAIVAQAEAAATEAEYWANQAALASGIPVGAKVVFAERLGVIPGTDVTAAAKALYDGLSDAIVIWSPGTYDLTDYILVNGDYVTTCCLAGRDAINIRQKTWGLPCFSTADPTNTSVRPNGVRFLDMGGEAWNNGVKCYFYDAFFGPGSAGPYTCSADLATTAAEVHLFRNGVYETPASISGLGTTTITLTLSTPQGASDYMLIKVTNKTSLDNGDALWGSDAAAECAFIYHGGGDDFVAERLRIEGFVCPVSYFGSWSSQASTHIALVQLSEISPSTTSTFCCSRRVVF
ncbi:hypothetical protein T190_17055 [Sinorhizobium meliloti CCBAU 01290]|nr:hypothetical protein T190_17055 [Sinorhizobium meliloti CCBAU 01290]